MKKFAIILIMIILFASSSCRLVDGEYIAPQEGIRVYNIDYIEKYENTLNAMFDKEWTLVLVEDKYEEPEEICTHVDTRPQQFIEWTIEYHDGNGDNRTFVFDNRSGLSSQIENYITDYISGYYKEKFYDVYIKDVPLAGSSYVFGFFVNNFVRTYYNDEYDDFNAAADKMEIITKKYIQNLETPEGTICLSKLTPANVFEMCPIYLSISVSFSGSSGHSQSFEESVMKQIEDMIEDMNKFTNNHLTVEINMGYHEIINLHTGSRNYDWAFVQGKQIFNVAGMDFDRYVFDGYRNMFW